MKKLFYLLFISSVLASCTKQEPVEVVCTCDGATNGTGTSTSSSFVDPNLVGHWKVTGLTSSNTNGWNNGEVNFHFFDDGNIVYSGTSVYSGYFRSISSYRTHSSNCIQLGTGLVNTLNYSINNGILTLTNLSGQNDTRWVIDRYGNIRFDSSLGVYDVEINNLVKQ